MDIDLLKTFLELNRTRHFGRAAENLHITQAAVSARIKQLEALLGTKLFVRSRNNLQLSPEGERLVNHADGILTAWTRAIQDVSLADSSEDYLSVSATSGLWHFVLSPKLSGISKLLPGTVIRADVDSEVEVSKQIQEAIIDIAILYEPLKSTLLVAQPLGELKLVLVGTAKDARIEEVFDGSYVFVDWGTRFKIFHARKFKESIGVALYTNTASIAEKHIFENDGFAYLPESIIAEKEGMLHKVKNAPEFSREIYGVFRKGTKKEALITSLLEYLKF